MKIAVILPVYNQKERLALTLAGFAGQEIRSGGRLEVIVVDDGSTDSVEPICEAWQGHMSIRYLRIPNAGRAVARNRGVAETDGELLLFNDADRVPARDFVQHHFDAHQKGDSIVIGQVRELYFSDPLLQRERIAEAIQEERFYKIPHYCKLVYQIFNGSGETESALPWLATFSGNMSLRRETFERIGRFDETFSAWGFEHFELGYRAYQAGVMFQFQESAVNYHLAHGRSNGFYRQAIEESHQIFYQKHQDAAIAQFKSFMFAECTLQEFERAVNPNAPSWLCRAENPLRVKIVNMGGRP